jgi:hypothetical protein
MTPSGHAGTCCAAFRIRDSSRISGSTVHDEHTLTSIVMSGAWTTRRLRLSLKSVCGVAMREEVCVTSKHSRKMR